MARNFEIIINCDESITMANGEKRLFTVEEAKEKANDHNCKWVTAPHVPDENASFNHYHFGIHTESDNTYETIAKWFGLPVNAVQSIRKKLEPTYLLYIIHYEKEGKTPVPVEKVESNFKIDYDKMIKNVKQKTNISEVLDKIASEEIKPYNITQNVDIETYSRNKNVFDRAFEYVMKNKKGMDREMKCIYLYGDSGTGKTTFAKMLASSKGYATYISSSGKNPLDDYQGEECIILDDIRGSIFSMSDFLKLTDNNTDSLVGCRYYNKSISYCKLIICTSVLSLEELYKGVTDDHKEPLTQLLRRFETVIKMDDEYMYYYYYEPEVKGLRYDSRCKNPVAIMFNRKVAKKTMKEFAEAFGLDVSQLEIEDGDKSNEADDFMKIPDTEIPFE